jgi:hypothetical protein
MRSSTGQEPGPQIELSRREFIGNASTVAAALCVVPALLIGREVEPFACALPPKDSEAMDDALESMAKLAPLSNHGPMAVEALIALGRAESVPDFVEAYKSRFVAAYPPARRPVTSENWREALGDGGRVADWSSFFNREMKENPWQKMLGKWVFSLAPGISAAAGHGLLRTSHAVRSLSVKDTAWRRRELAEGLGYWAAYYQPLPERSSASSEKLAPGQAIQRVPLLPSDKRVRNVSIMQGLESLNSFTPFADVVGLLADPGSLDQCLSELTEGFASTYLQGVNQGGFIALVHCVTTTTCLRSLLPYLEPVTAHKVLRYGWQAAAGIYSVYGSNPSVKPAAVKILDRNELIDRAVASKAEHAIKFTEACLRNHSINPKPIYLQAASDAILRFQA